jgi:hypothetical protein
MRVRAWFSSEKEAIAEAKKRNKELTDYGMKALSLTASQRAQAEEALQILEPYGLTLIDAANDRARWSQRIQRQGAVS